MHLIGNARVTEGEGLFSWSRLLQYLAYFLIYKVAGFSAIAFHALNLLIHLVLSAFVLWSMRDFGRYILPQSGSAKTGWLSLPLLVALVFACHPLGSEPVNYARCTPIMLVGAFSYVAAWATLRWFCVSERRGEQYDVGRRSGCGRNVQQGARHGSCDWKRLSGRVVLSWTDP